ncbi:MAG TPA: menaquinone biosynthesis decarboxylase [Thermoplasmata archaeon]|nr:menaquinone biosynthesis decarboxylase [Thermoplasmata archaeon]
MGFGALGEFLAELESAGDLLRVRTPVARDLEITEITQRAVARDGPALLFENVPGATMPVATNVLGSHRRIARALGAADLGSVADKIGRLVRLRPPAGVVGALKDLGGTLATLELLRNLGPKHRSSGPCQEVEEANVDLDRLPILRCWPGDGGRTITFPVVVTSDPETGEPHTGVYRLQQYGPDTLGMHFQVHRVGANNYRKWAARGERMPVVAAIGCDPATVLAGLAPVPEGVSNFVFAGFLNDAPLELVKARSVDLDVPAQAEVVLEGYVDPVERHIEGPFGDHTGYYSAPEPFPVFHVTRVTRRERPVYFTTVTGKPPTEDAVIGKAIERVFLPIVRLVIPEITDMNLPMEGLFINVGIVAIRKSYPDHARKVMHALWGLGQLMFLRYIVVVDEDVNVHDLGEVLYRVGLQADPARDLELVQGPVDQLSISNAVANLGGKVGVDATRKRPEDGFPRPWPEEIRMDPGVVSKVDALLRSDPVLRRLLGPNVAS